MPLGIRYPIIEERSLRPPQRRLGIFARRDLNELPDTPTGTVLVFAVKGRYTAHTEGHHLKGSEEAVVEAVSVSVVDVRSRQISFEILIPSRDLGYRFPVRVLFNCKVTDPEAVVAAGVNDAAQILANHLRNDAQLMQLGTKRAIEEAYLLSMDVTNRIQAYLEFYPPQIDGLKAHLTNVDLLLPNEVITHGKGLKRLQWEQESKELHWAIENRDVSRIEEIFKRGTEAATALGISRDQLLMTDAVSITREAEEQRMKYLSDLINHLPEGSLDFLPVDTYTLINRVMRSVAGIEPFVEETQTTDRAQLLKGRHAANEDDRPRRIRLEDLDD